MTTPSSSEERSRALFGLWAQVNQIACTTEDAGRIRALIAEAGIEPDIHVGRDPSEFTPEVTTEWVLGQWAAMIDAGAPFLNSARNVSIHQWERVTGQRFQVPPAALRGDEWFVDELRIVVQGKDRG